MEDFKQYDEDMAAKYNNCFVCSQTNPHGLHLVNQYIDGKSHMELQPHKHMEGLNGLMHGGFSMMLMDEIMYYAAEQLDVDVVTITSSVNFVSPAYLDHMLIAEGEIERVEGRKVFTKGVLTDSVTGKTVMTANAIYYQVDMNKFLSK